ncbi:hypothetical protein C8J57DRAFT_1237423 [Mycena rebaudengoi]|nr:hypothetical protein C8J57DRAFT_1237423 [Mycena rebaudengoi]
MAQLGILDKNSSMSEAAKQGWGKSPVHKRQDINGEMRTALAKLPGASPLSSSHLRKPGASCGKYKSWNSLSSMGSKVFSENLVDFSSDPIPDPSKCDLSSSLRLQRDPKTRTLRDCSSATLVTQGPRLGGRVRRFNATGGHSTSQRTEVSLVNMAVGAVAGARNLSSEDAVHRSKSFWMENYYRERGHDTPIWIRPDHRPGKVDRSALEVGAWILREMREH